MGSCFSCFSFSSTCNNQTSQFNDLVLNCIKSGQFNLITEQYPEVFATFIEICNQYLINCEYVVDPIFLNKYAYLFLFFPDSRKILLVSRHYEILQNTNDGVETLLNSEHKLLLLKTKMGIDCLVRNKQCEILYNAKFYDQLFSFDEGIKYIFDNNPHNHEILLSNHKGVDYLFQNKYYGILTTSPELIMHLFKMSTKKILTDIITDKLYSNIFMKCPSSFCKNDVICEYCDIIYSTLVESNANLLLTTDNSCRWLAKNEKYSHLLLSDNDKHSFLANYQNKHNISLLYSNGSAHLLTFDSKIFKMMDLQKNEYSFVFDTYGNISSLNNSQSFENIIFNISDIDLLINICTKQYIVLKNNNSIVKMIYRDKFAYDNTYCGDIRTFYYRCGVDKYDTKHNSLVNNVQSYYEQYDHIYNIKIIRYLLSCYIKNPKNHEFAKAFYAEAIKYNDSFPFICEHNLPILLTKLDGALYLLKDTEHHKTLLKNVIGRQALLTDPVGIELIVNSEYVYEYLDNIKIQSHLNDHATERQKWQTQILHFNINKKNINYKNQNVTISCPFCRQENDKYNIVSELTCDICFNPNVTKMGKFTNCIHHLCVDCINVIAEKKYNEKPEQKQSKKC